MIRKLIPAAVLLGGLAAASSALATTPCDKLAAMTAPDFKITASKAVAAGPFTPPGAKAALDLPAFCRVQAIATPTPDSEIRFEVWIPQGGAWNSKFQGVGTGGYQGSISYPAMGEALRRGYAVTSTDMGHQGDDLVFGQGHPEKVVDWAYRAIHVTAQAGKLVVRNATGRFPERSYFVGCATGGHQAMSEVQRFPADYDGVIAGNPANNRLNETAGYLWAWRATHDAAGKALLSRADLQLVTNSATAACDSIDGVKDGVIDDPRLCRFDVASITCKGAKTASCLTSEQVTAVKKVHGGLKNPRTGEEIFPGWPLGSEGYGETANQGWAAFLVEPKAPMRSEVYKYFLFHDPNWDHRTFDFDRDVAYANAKIGFVSAIDDDLAPFRARGGKLIMYTGWADPVLPAADVIEIYDDIQKTNGGLAGTNGFYRLFMVPGIGHCSGGPGPTQFDMVPALEQWVEKGIAPERVIASRTLQDGALRTRPLCAYPKAARWTGRGGTDDAANFVCAAPPKGR
jgi:feruloyl esterase